MSSERPVLRVDQSGSRPLVTKHAASKPATDRLRAELDLLRRAQHPGVVTLIDSTDDGDEIMVRTRYCGSRTLETTGSLTVGRAAGIVAALAATVADLHELGIAHGRITTDHVLIASDGRPVLCGFGEASFNAESTEFDEDVRCLGALLSDVLAPLDDAAPIPTSRMGRRGAWTGYQRRALLNLADQATADDPLVRPSARQFAQNLRSTVPDASLAEPADSNLADVGDGRAPVEASATGAILGRWKRPGGRSDATGVASRRVSVAGFGAAGCVLFATILVATNASAGDTDPGIPDEATVELAPETGASTSPGPFGDAIEVTPGEATSPVAPDDERSDGGEAEEPASSIERAEGCNLDPTAEIAALASGSPCPVEVVMNDGIIEIADHAFHLDVDNPAVSIGRFACSEHVRAAVLDLDDGTVFVFDRWADDEALATAAALTSIEDARRLLAEPQGPSCHRLVVLDSFGIRHVLDVPPATEET